jgi:hypothetical protein
MRIRLVLCLSVIVALGGVGLAFVQENNPSDLLKTADEMLQITARLRGLDPKAPISRGVKNRAEISQFVNEQVKENYADAEIQQESKLLRILDLLPPSTNYKDIIVNLYTEQIGGFYDPDKKTFFIASWLPVTEQKPVMVHELDHALQDQYFNIGKILKEDHKLNKSDSALAHQAFFEGDAMAVMMNYLLEPAKRNFSQLPDLVFTLRNLTEAQQSQFEVFKNAPPFLKETVFFPYVYGTAFIQKIWMRNPSWDAVNKVYADLPASTEQIMHPEKYFGTRDEPKPVYAEAIATRLGSSWKIIYKDVLGEFALGLVLSAHLSEEHSRRSATGWGGDQVLLLENAAGKNAVLVDTVWDTPEEADKFFEALQSWFQQKLPNARKSDETTAGFSLSQDKEIHWIRREGAGVQFIVGLPESDAPLIRDPKFWLKN